MYTLVAADYGKIVMWLDPPRTVQTNASTTSTEVGHAAVIRMPQTDRRSRALNLVATLRGATRDGLDIQGAENRGGNVHPLIAGLLLWHQEDEIDRRIAQTREVSTALSASVSSSSSSSSSPSSSSSSLSTSSVRPASTQPSWPSSVYVGAQTERTASHRASSPARSEQSAAMGDVGGANLASTDFRSPRRRPVSSST